MFRKVSIFISIFLLSSGIVLAVTLTKEAVEKVVIPVAVEGRVCVWSITNQQCAGPEEPIVFGSGLVYGKGGVNQPPVVLNFFFFRDKIYRSSGGGGVSIGGSSTISSGLASQVDPGGTEILNVFNYTITYRPSGPFVTITQQIDEFMKRVWTLPQVGATQDLKIEFLEQNQTQAPPPSGSDMQSQIESLKTQIESLKSESGKPVVITETLVLQTIIREVSDITWIPQ